ncbi:MAG: PqqD family protein [Ruminococcus sp.]|nr:PqqD family protein [Ruminococcus sp.]
MKLKESFIMHNDGTESILISANASEFSGLVKGNKTFGCILECLATETTEEEIVLKLSEKYDADKETIAKDVQNTLVNLRKIGALDE